MDSYSHAAIQDPKLQQLMAKAKVHDDESLTAIFPAKSPNRLTIRLKGGRVLQRQVDDLPGFAGGMLSRVKVEENFRRYVNALWSEAQTRRVLDALWNLESADTLDGVLGQFVVRVPDGAEG